MKLIPLYGKYAIGDHSSTLVDDEDFEELYRYKWKAKPNPNGTQTYAIRNFKGKDGRTHAIRMHRKVLGIPWDGLLDIDHINKNPLDNQRSNLRLVTRSENLKNKTDQAKLNLAEAAKRRRGKSIKEGKWLCSPHLCKITFGTCRACGKSFRKCRKNQQCCSRRCRFKSQIRHYQDRRKTQWDRESICDQCGKGFIRKQPNQITCSALCKRKRNVDRARQKK